MRILVTSECNYQHGINLPNTQFRVPEVRIAPIMDISCTALQTTEWAFDDKQDFGKWISINYIAAVMPTLKLSRHCLIAMFTRSKVLGSAPSISFVQTKRDQARKENNIAELRRNLFVKKEIDLMRLLTTSQGGYSLACL